MTFDINKHFRMHSSNLIHNDYLRSHDAVDSFIKHRKGVLID